MESSAELLYLQELYDPNDEFGFADKLERHQALQWLFFWHGSGAPYLAQMAHFGRFAKDKILCTSHFLHFLPTRDEKLFLFFLTY